MNGLKSREWIVLIFFLVLLLSLIIISKVSDVKTDKKIEQHFSN